MLGGLAGRAKAEPLRGSDYPVFPSGLPIKKPGNAGLLKNELSAEDQLPTLT
jgi:hypothetical protein